MALGKQRIMPQGLYSQHVICKQQDQLIARLRHVDLDHMLVEVLRSLASQMLDGGPSSGLGILRSICSYRYISLNSLILISRNVCAPRISSNAYISSFSIRFVA